MNQMMVDTAFGAFRCYDDNVGKALANGRFWDEQLRPAIDATAALMHGKGWAIDLGANVGWFTVYLARLFDHVLAVEAHPQTFLMLLENLRANGVAHRVTPLLAAAYNRHALLSLGSPARHGWEIPNPATLEGTVNPSSVGFAIEEGAFSIPALPISQQLEPTTPISLIKSDVQGCDYRALQGLLPTIIRWRPTILFELEEGMQAWHGEHGGISHFDGLLLPLQYTIRRIWTHHWDYVAVPAESPLASMELAPS